PVCEPADAGALADWGGQTAEVRPVGNAGDHRRDSACRAAVHRLELSGAVWCARGVGPHTFLDFVVVQLGFSLRAQRQLDVEAMDDRAQSRLGWRILRLPL